MTLPSPLSTASPHYDLLIIGAGIAGLAAGRMAQQAGLKVMLIDKARRVGGRISTRHTDGFVFNHGAQFATSNSSDFKDILRAAITAGTATNWQIEDKKTVVIGTPMMRALPMFLAENLPIQQNRRIASIIRKKTIFNLLIQHDIVWAMCETARPSAAQHRPALTIQADAAWSAAHKDDRVDSIIKQLIDKYQLATECQIGEVYTHKCIAGSMQK